MTDTTAEHHRLASSVDDDSAWRRWGPYMAARQWGTVREDYSADGNAWEHFDFDQAHLRAYRWGEDAIAGVCDRFGFANLAVALWNGRDDRLKERPFGLTNPQGNHGEDVKEYYWPLDALPTHAFGEFLYRYPQAAYPYTDLVEANAQRGATDREYELRDTGILAQDRFFDVTVTHAKAHPTDLCMVVRATNHGPEPAPLHLIPQYWFRNTWAWGRDDRVPSITVGDDHADHTEVVSRHAWLGEYRLAVDHPERLGAPTVLWCDNESNAQALWGQPNPSPHPKDSVNRAIVHGQTDACRAPSAEGSSGTKVAFWFHTDAVAPGETIEVRVRLTHHSHELTDPFGATFDQTLADRRREADEFYAAVIPAEVSDRERALTRRAFAGLCWNKQVYRYSVREWLQGDPSQPAPPPSRRAQEPWGRNTDWTNLDLADVISMPDDWEYPWFAAWDLAFHCVAFAHIDPAFAKNQLLLMCREWAQHPNGQLPAYEWRFSDVNPPVHAWAALQVYLAEGAWDTEFLVRVITKLLLNSGWWVNRKDEAGNNLFEGGFLGMDNISLFDRSTQVPDGWRLEQSDATSWIAFHTLVMMRISQELARKSPAWDEIATTFFERFLSISQAMERFGTGQVSLWDDEDGFFYDALVSEDGQTERVPVRSLVGLVPLLAVANTQSWVADELPEFSRRRRWLAENRPDLNRWILTEKADEGHLQTMSLVDPPRLGRVLRRLFDPEEFLSEHGIRSLSAAYRDGLHVRLVDQDMFLKYLPGESDTGMFGGNSNWRGPIWFPLNCLLIDSLRHRGDGVGGHLTHEFPTGSGHQLTLAEIADQLSDRLVALWAPDDDGRVVSTPRDHGGGPLWDTHPTFSEYFDADTGEGLGASHQTGWTAMVAHLVIERATHQVQQTESRHTGAGRTRPSTGDQP